MRNVQVFCTLCSQIKQTHRLVTESLPHLFLFSFLSSCTFLYGVHLSPAKTSKMTDYWKIFLSMLIPVYKFFVVFLKNDHDVIANECWQMTN